MLIRSLGAWRRVLCGRSFRRCCAFYWRGRLIVAIATSGRPSLIKLRASCFGSHYGCAALWVMESEQVTLDRWFETMDQNHDRMYALLDALLTSLDEIDKSLVGIAQAIGDLV